MLSLAILCACVVTAQCAAKPSAIKLPRTTGHAAGEAFIFRAEDGFDGDNYRISDYEIRRDWIDAGFSPDNVNFLEDHVVLSIDSRSYGSRNFTGAEFQKKGFYGYGRYEVVMQGIGGEGVVSSFFTHTHEQFGDPHDEIDIEFLGRNTRQVHLNYFRNGEPGGAVSVDLPFDFTQADHLYAFEWSPESIKWFADGRQIHEAREKIPVASGRVIAHVWAAGQETRDWLGEPKAVGGGAAIRCFSHVPLGQTGPQCSDTLSPPM
jgi:beta-glucanase (GH16 family)